MKSHKDTNFGKLNGKMVRVTFVDGDTFIGQLFIKKNNISYGIKTEHSCLMFYKSHIKKIEEV